MKNCQELIWNSRLFIINLIGNMRKLLEFGAILRLTVPLIDIFSSNLVRLGREGLLFSGIDKLVSNGNTRLFSLLVIEVRLL